MLLLGNDQRFIHELRQELEHRVGLDTVAGDHGLGCFEGPPAGEHREAAQNRSFGLRQQGMAPVDRRLQGLLARHGGPWTRAEQAKTVVQPCRNLRDGEDAYTRGGKLECERDAFQPPTDLSHCRRIDVHQVELGPGGTHTFGE